MKRWATVATVGFAAALLVAIGSGIPSLWNDEAATLRLARLPLPQMLSFVLEKDAVHAVYAVILHGWIGLFGESEWAIRSFSAIAVGIAASGVFALAGEVTRPSNGYIAALVFTVLPRTTFNGSEARSYALATALIVWAALWAVFSARRGHWWRWSIFACLTGASIAVFMYALLIVPALATLTLVSASEARRVAMPFTVSSGLAILGTSPVLLLAMGQRGQVAWLQDQPVNAWTVFVEPYFEQSWWMAALVLLVTMFGLVRKMRGREHQPRTFLVFALWIAFPTLILVLGSAIIGPLYTPRYLSITTPALAILISVALGEWRRMTAWALAVAVALAATPTFVEQRTSVGKPGGVDLRGLASTLESQASPGDAFLLSSSGRVSLRPRVALAAYPHDFKDLVDIEFEQSYATTGTYSDLLIDDKKLENRLRNTNRVWVALPSAGDTNLEDVVEIAGLKPLNQYDLEGFSLTLWAR